MDKSLYETEIKKIKDQIKKIYLEDEIPWVVGYSGGKDSTAVTQLVWECLEELESEKRHKAVYIISKKKGKKKNSNFEEFISCFGKKMKN